MIRLITRQQLFDKLTYFLQSAFGTPATDQFRIVEIGPPVNFQKLHIRGAISITLSELNRDPHLWLDNPATDIVVYGENPMSEDPRRALDILETRGFLNLFYYAGGKSDWRSSNLWTQSRLVPADHFTNALPDLTPNLQKAA